MPSIGLGLTEENHSPTPHWEGVTPFPLLTPYIGAQALK
jgi:hypothetical protein